MRILIIAQNYRLPGRQGGARFNTLARLWAAAGHQVTVLASTVDYATGEIPERFQNRWHTRTQDGPTTVWRCYTPDRYHQGYKGRALSFVGYTLSSATAAFRVPRPDVIVASSPPLITAMPGWLAARLRWRKVPWVFEMRDLWPESAVTTGVLDADSPITRALYSLERQACRRAQAINVLTPAFVEDLVDRGLARREDIFMVPNGADVGGFQPGQRDNQVRTRLGWKDRFVVTYAGAHGRANHLGQLLDAAALLRQRDDIRFVTVGDGPQRAELLKRVQRDRLHNVQLVGARDREEMPGFFNASDVCTAVLQDNPTFRGVYPRKIFDYMSCARPILLGIDGVARDLVVDQAQAGVFTPPENPQAFVDNLMDLRERPAARAQMGERGRAWVEQHASWEALAGRYLHALERVAA